MLPTKLFHWMHRLALFAVVFASLAPSISHALAAKQGVNSFTQEICRPNGETITIEVVTNKGLQLSTELTTEAPDSTTTNPLHHLNHCQFCSNPITGHAIVPSHALIVATLEAQAQKIDFFTQAVLPRFSVLPPPAQAPPQL